MTRLQPKLTAEDKRLCSKLATSFLCGDKVMLEHVLAEIDEADVVTNVMLGLLDMACQTLERTGPLLPPM